MKTIGEILQPALPEDGGSKGERNIILATKDPFVLGGFTQLPNLILRNGGISGNAKCVYSLFLSYAWNNAFCFPGQDRLAKDMGMSVSSISNFVKELESLGLLAIKRRGQGRTNLYTLYFMVRKQAGKRSADSNRLKSRFQKNGL